MKTFRMFLLLLLLPLALAGCHIHHHDDDSDADVELFWQFDGSGCLRAGVHSVRVVIEEIRGRDSYDSGEIPCHDGSFFFADIDEGPYLVRAYGYGSRRGPATWALEGEFRIRRGFNEFTLDLAPVW